MKLLDCQGRDFGEIRSLGLLPERTADWPAPGLIKFSGLKRWKFFDELHAEEAWKCCAVCGVNEGALETLRIEIHHLPGGNGRRSDERATVVPLCALWAGGGCHENVATIGLARLLYARWKLESSSCDWLRLHQVARFWLPTPDPTTPNPDQR